MQSLKLIFFLLIFISLSFGNISKTEDISMLSAVPVYDLDTQRLPRTLTRFLQDNKEVKAVTIIDGISKKKIFTFYRDGENLVFQEEIPKEFLTLEKFVTNITYDGEVIGSTEAYFQPLQAVIKYSKKEREWLSKNPINRVAVMEYWPHNEYGESLHTEILKLINKYAGTNMVPVKYSAWGDGFEVASKGKDLNGIMGLSWSQEREDKYFFYTPAYNFTPCYLIVRKDNKSIKTVADLHNKTIYLKENSITHKMMDKISPTTKILDKKTVEDMYQALSENSEVDGMISYFIDEDKLDNYDLKLVKAIYDRYGEVSIGVHHKYPHLASIINKAFKIIPKVELSQLRDKRWGERRELLFNFTKEEKKWINDHPIINIGGETDWAPFDFVNDSGIHDGLAKDYATYIAKVSGFELKFHIGKSWVELLDDLQNGKIDMIPAIYLTEERKGSINFTNPYLVLSEYIFTKSSYKDIEELSQLNNKTVAQVKGFYLSTWLKKNYPEMTIIEKESVLEALKSVESGESEAFIGDKPSALYNIRKAEIKGLKLNSVIREKKAAQLSMGIKKGYEPLAGIFNKVLSAMPIKDKEKLTAKWFTETLALTEAEKTWLNKNEAIKYVYDPQWKPFEWKSDIGTHTGIISDLLRVIEEKSGINFKAIDPKTWEEAVDLVKSNQASMFSGVGETEERKKYLNYTTNKLYSTPYVLVSRHGEDYLDGLTNLTKERVGILKDSTIHGVMQSEKIKRAFVEIENTKKGFRDLRESKIDLLIVNAATAKYYINMKGYKDLKIAYKTKYTLDLKIALRKDAPKEALSIIDKAIHSISEKELGDIYFKWTEVQVEKETDWILIGQFSGAIFLVLLVVSFYNVKLKSTVNKKTAEITEQKEQLARLVDSFDKNVIASKTDIYGNITYVSAAFCRISEYSQEELIGKTHKIIRHPDMDRAFFKKLWTTIKSGEVFKGEMKNLKKSGGFYWVDTIITPLYTKENKLIGYSAIRQDITSKKEVEDLSNSLEQKVEEKTEDLNKQLQLLQISERRQNELFKESEFRKKEIEKIHKQVRDSIEYAALIQGALIPDNSLFKDFFSDYFIYWEPKDTVGGDIYLLEGLRNKDECLLLYVDCTGHGVPGAFVTMIVKAIEREIVVKIRDDKELVVSPGEIMGYFNNTMKLLLRQESKESNSNAGWDGGIIYYNKKSKILKFAGAETELFYIDNSDTIHRVKGNRYSVGYKKCSMDYNYKETIIDVEKGMKFYLTTDGYLDQNGGKKDFPFGKKRFINIIKENHTKNMEQQKSAFIKDLNTYQEQVADSHRNDDVTVLGIEI